MIKWPGTRNGVEALRYWALSGAKFPDALPEHFSLEWSPHGLILVATNLEIVKGRNSVTLLSPSLSDHLLLTISAAVEFVEEFGQVQQSISVFDKTSLVKASPVLTVSSKEAKLYSGPVAQYYLLSDR